MAARWLVGLALGLRQGEALGLWWEDIDLHARVRRALQRQRGGGLVFTVPKTDRSRRTIHDYREFKKLLGKAGLPSVRLHDLRHTAASLLVAQGVPPRVVMEILGHSQIALTMNTYSHVSPEVSREAADRIAEALWQDGDDQDCKPGSAEPDDSPEDDD